MTIVEARLASARGRSRSGAQRDLKSFLAHVPEGHKPRIAPARSWAATSAVQPNRLRNPEFCSQAVHKIPVIKGNSLRVENAPYPACQWQLWRHGPWVLIHIDVSCAPSGRCTFGEWTRGVAGRCPACPGLQSRRPSGGPRRRCTMPTRGAAPGPAPGERSCRPSGGPRRRWRLKAEPCAHTPFVARLSGSWGRLKGGRKIARGSDLPAPLAPTNIMA